MAFEFQQRERQTMISKVLIAIVAFGGIVGLAGCKPKETQYARYNREANEEMLEYCTNNIIGLNRFISIDLRHFITDSNNNILKSDIDDPHNWEGKIVVEYVNHVGGIDRTNLVFRFTLDTNEFRIPKDCVTLDYHWQGVQEAAKMKAEEEARLKSLDNKQ
jgi:hypothetical protein